MAKVYFMYKVRVSGLNNIAYHFDGTFLIGHVFMGENFVYPGFRPFSLEAPLPP
jgi:hypothetical protein